MTIRLHRGDLPDPSRYTGAVAIDTETMGLDLAPRPAVRGAAVVRRRFRRCGADRGRGNDAPNLKRLLADPKVLKIFHFGRFDIGMMRQAFGVMPAPVYCTKIASRLAAPIRTSTA